MSQKDDAVKETVDTLDKELNAKTQSSKGESNTMLKAKEKNKEKGKEKVAKKASPAKLSKPNPSVKPVDDGNMVTLSSIADEHKVNPAELRKALRSSKIKKPGDSWRWPKGHTDLKEVKKLAEGLAA